MHSIKLIFFLSFGSMLLSCNEPKKTLDVEVIRLDNSLSFDFNEKFELAYKIPLETNSECLLSYIMNIAIIDDYIYIMDAAHQFYIFDKEGNFVNQIGSKGHGPGEYLNISDFYVDDSIAVLVDFGNDKLIHYDKSGNHLHDEKLPAKFLYMNNQDDFNIVYMGNNGGDFAYAGKGSYYRLLFYTSDYDVISGYSIFPARSLGVNYNTGSPFFEYSGKSFFIESINDTIYRIEGAQIKPAYVVDFGKHKRPGDFLDKTPVTELFSEMTDGDYAKGISVFYDLSDLIYFYAFIGNQNNKHVFYDKITGRTKVASDIIDIVNNIKVKPRTYKSRGEKLYFLSIISPVDVLDNPGGEFDDSNPTLVFYKLKNIQ